MIELGCGTADGELVHTDVVTSTAGLAASAVQPRWCLQESIISHPVGIADRYASRNGLLQIFCSVIPG
jgi:hypothetical protein